MRQRGQRSQRSPSNHTVALRRNVGSGLGWTSGIPQSVEGATPSVVQATARKTVYDRGLLKRVEQARAGSRAAELSAAAREEEIAFRVAATFLDFERESVEDDE